MKRRGSARVTQHDSLLHLINGVKLPAVVDSQGLQMTWAIHRFKSGLLGAHVRLNEGDILTPQVRDQGRNFGLKSGGTNSEG